MPFVFITLQKCATLVLSCFCFVKVSIFFCYRYSPLGISVIYSFVYELEYSVKTFVKILFTLYKVFVKSRYVCLSPKIIKYYKRDRKIIYIYLFIWTILTSDKVEVNRQATNIRLITVIRIQIKLLKRYLF